MSALSQVIDGMTREVYERLKHSLEVRRWPDGRPMSEDQLADTMQMVIGWEHRHLPPEEHSGFVPDVCRTQADDEAATADLIAREDGSAGNHD